MIVAAAMVVLVGRRLNVPNIVLYIVTGVVLGPVLGIGNITEAQHATEDGHGGSALGVVAEVGIALLLFLVGLELSLAKIRDIGKVAVAAGIGQVVFTAVIGFALSMALQFSVMESVFLATALTFSSTVVVVKLLDQKKELHALYGRIAVGIFLVQDLVVIIVLTFLAGLGGGAGEVENAEAGYQWLDMAWGLTWAFVGMGLLLGAALLASRYLLDKPFAWMAVSSEGLLIWSLFWCFAFVVGAEWMGLSPEIGAFLAGMSLAQLDGSQDLRRRVHPLMNFFIAIFFVSLGAQMRPADALEHWLAGLVLSLFVLIGNPFIFMWIIAKSGYTERTSFLTSVTVAQISEFSFIFAAVGLSAGLIDESILALITVIGLVTIGVSSYMILYNHQLYVLVKKWGLLRLFKARQDSEEKPAPVLRGHVVVVGMNAMGCDIVHKLSARGETLLAIDTDARKLKGLPSRTMIGSVDHMAVIEEAHMADAKLVVSTLHIEDTNNLLAYRCKQMGVPVAIHAFDRSVVSDLRRLGVDYQIDPKSRWVEDVTTALERSGIKAAAHPTPPTESDTDEGGAS
ncbi:MAG: cation:proton antiporter [Phycisphaeraceae bacterium]